MNGAPTVDVNGTVFSYAEVRTGHRAIKIWTAGVQPITYRIDPDPHGKQYDRNPPKFYLQLATEIGTQYLANGNVMPVFGSQAEVDLTGETYTLNEP